MKPQSDYQQQCPDTESPDDALKDKLARTPKSPGVYLMKNASGKIIYVGKASSLKNRIRSYFSGSPARTDAKTGVLVKHVTDFETIVTASETEALILESNLIKRYRPRYNVILKDDKRYPSLRMDLSQPYPNLTVVRKTKKDGALYFGPYASAGAVRQTLKMIHRVFKLRKCKSSNVKPRSRPCLNYQIGICLAPCCYMVDPEEYRKIVHEVRMFLQGRTPDLIGRIRAQMHQAAEIQDYEAAAQFRDKMHALEKTLEKQVAVTTDFVDRDVIAVERLDEKAMVMLLKVRNGYLQGMRDFLITDAISEATEILGAFIRQYYEDTEKVPDEILMQFNPLDKELYVKWLAQLRGRRVLLHTPVRGEKKRLVEMAAQNASQRLKSIVEEESSAASLLSGLQKRLGMENYPRRIECLDNSGLFGTDLVAGLVVFENGVPKKSHYRHYTIAGVSGQDDYGCMREVLFRRFSGPEDEKHLPYPDLLMVDGGKGQLNIALAVLKELDISDRFAVIGIAKKDEARGEARDKIYLPGRANPANFQQHPGQLHLLEQIRDEAHRRAVSFHRKRRNARGLHSALDDIAGIGPKRKTILLKHFGSIEAIATAGEDELAALPGMTRKAARALHLNLMAP